MTLDQLALDQLWDFSDAVTSEHRFRESGGDPELRTQLARALVLQGRFEEATVELDAVEASGADASGAADVDPAVRARVALERGRLANSSGDQVGAIPFFAAAEEIARTAGLEFLEVDAIHMLAIADAEGSALHAERALSRVAEATLPRTRRWGVSLHNNLGWTLFDGGDASGALAEFAASLAEAKQWGTTDQQLFSRWAIARAYRELGRHAEALELQEALFVEQPGDSDVLEELAILRGV